MAEGSWLSLSLNWSQVSSDLSSLSPNCIFAVPNQHFLNFTELRDLSKDAKHRKNEFNFRILTNTLNEGGRDLWLGRGDRGIRYKKVPGRHVQEGPSLREDRGAAWRFLFLDLDLVLGER